MAHDASQSADHTTLDRGRVVRVARPYPIPKERRVWSAAASEVRQGRRPGARAAKIGVDAEAEQAARVAGSPRASVPACVSGLWG